MDDTKEVTPGLSSPGRVYSPGERSVQAVPAPQESGIAKKFRRFAHFIGLGVVSAAAISSAQPQSPDVRAAPAPIVTPGTRPEEARSIDVSLAASQGPLSPEQASALSVNTLKPTTAASITNDRQHPIDPVKQQEGFSAVGKYQQELAAAGKANSAQTLDTIDKAPLTEAKHNEGNPAPTPASEISSK